MDLHAIAEADLAFTLEGGGQTVTLTDPAQTSVELQAISNDISLMIDPQTGAPVSGRNANVAFRISSIRAAGLEIPKGTEDGATRPWVVEYTTVNGSNIKTVIIGTDPDRGLGLVTCRLALAEDA